MYLQFDEKPVPVAAAHIAKKPTNQTNKTFPELVAPAWGILYVVIPFKIQALIGPIHGQLMGGGSSPGYIFNTI